MAGRNSSAGTSRATIVSTDCYTTVTRLLRTVLFPGGGGDDHQHGHRLARGAHPDDRHLRAAGWLLVGHAGHKGGVPVGAERVWRFEADTHYYKWHNRVFPHIPSATVTRPVSIVTLVRGRYASLPLQKLKGSVSIPLVATNRINTPEIAENILEQARVTARNVT